MNALRLLIAPSFSPSLSSPAVLNISHSNHQGARHTSLSVPWNAPSTKLMPRAHSMTSPDSTHPSLTSEGLCHIRWQMTHGSRLGQPKSGTRQALVTAGVLCREALAESPFGKSLRCQKRRLMTGASTPSKGRNHSAGVDITTLSWKKSLSIVSICFAVKLLANGRTCPLLQAPLYGASHNSALMARVSHHPSLAHPEALLPLLVPLLMVAPLPVDDA